MLVAAGTGWSMWVPVDVWDRMTDAERAELADAQTVLMTGASSLDEQRR